MASKINPTNIDVTYPVAGQDNDTKGFRDNFTSIKNNFLTAASEISSIQASLVNTPVLTNPPISSTAAGTKGQMAFDSEYFYVCVADHTWIRVACETSFP